MTLRDDKYFLENEAKLVEFYKLHPAEVMALLCYNGPWVYMISVQTYLESRGRLTPGQLRKVRQHLCKSD